MYFKTLIQPGEIFLILILTAALLFAAGGTGAFLFLSRKRFASRIGILLCLAGCVCGLAGALPALSGFQEGEQRVWWTLSFSFDALSALFLLPVFLIGGAAALHAIGYFGESSAAGRFWGVFNFTLAAMTWVALAVTPVEFLTAWELMGVMSFALVAFDWKEKETVRAAWIYLLSCQAGAALLILMFVYGASENVPPAFMGAVIALGLAGFGLKAGFPVLHVWLPEAHPAAPAPVSALMSGSMINLGFYGILRMLVSSDGPVGVFGWSFLCLGLAGALGGVLSALAQRNVKRLLACSSVENMGIAGIGFGLGFLGVEHGNLVMAAFGCAGAFLHILNHALLKGALFLCAGSVFRATGLLDMDRLGGLLKRMPWTGSVFLFSSLSISGLPPFNGFFAEFLIYMAALAGVAAGSGALFAGSVLTVVALALTGGLAAAVFVKAAGAVFLGEPRSKEAAEAVERPLGMRISQMVLLILAFGMVAGAPLVCRTFTPLIQHFTGFPPEAVETEMFRLAGLTARIALFSGVTVLVAAGLLIYRLTLPNGRRSSVRPTWDCGFSEPTARMEYTGSALVQPLTGFFSGILRPKRTVRRPEGFFPVDAGFEEVTEDLAERGIWRPLFSFAGRMADRIHRFQSGFLHVYLLVMVLAVLAMLAWGFLFREEKRDLPSGEPGRIEVTE